MARVSLFAVCSFVALALGTSACSGGHGAEAPLDPIMGEFAGTLTGVGASAVQAEGKVLADEDGKYRVYLLYPAGQAKPTRIELTGIAKDGGVSINSPDWSGSVGRETLQAASTKGVKAEMKRTVRTSPTLAQQPPVGAVVLLPFDAKGPTNLDLWNNKKWKLLPDGSTMTLSGDNKTLKDFGSFKLHVEFCVPFVPAGRGQGRGNSGVYLHGRYEIQLLDSFGLTMNPGECGAIYGQKPPDCNASLPPGQWQTYDIDFKAPQFDADGKQIRGALITVVLNGVKIQDAVETTKVTGGAWGVPAKTGPVRLQDHGNPMRFRNIWLVEQQ